MCFCFFWTIESHYPQAVSVFYKIEAIINFISSLPYTGVFNNGYYFNISFLYKGKREVRLRVFFYSLLFLVAHLVKKSTCNVGDLGLISGLGRFPWRSKRLPTPVSWPGEFHGLYSPWGSQRFGHDWATFTFTVLQEWRIMMMAENEEKSNSFLRVKEESEKAGLELNIKNLRSWHLVSSLHGK